VNYISIPAVNSLSNSLLLILKSLKISLLLSSSGALVVVHSLGCPRPLRTSMVLTPLTLTGWVVLTSLLTRASVTLPFGSSRLLLFLM